MRKATIKRRLFAINFLPCTTVHVPRTTYIFSLPSAQATSYNLFMSLLSFGPCRKRSVQIPRMDTPEVEDDDLLACYQFIDSLDSLTGGGRLLRRFLSQGLNALPPGGLASVLDLYGGTGRRGARLAQWGKRKDVDLKVLSVEPYGRIIQMARDQYRSVKNVDFDVRGFNHSSFLQAQQVDYVVSFFAMNRLSEAEAVQFVKKARFLARKGVMIVDWSREMPAWTFVQGAAKMRRNALVQAEGKLFVERAFTQREFASLVSEAGGDPALISTQPPFRMAYMEDRVVKPAAAFVRGLAGA